LDRLLTRRLFVIPQKIIHARATGLKPAFPASPMHEFGRMIQPAYRVLLFLAMASTSPRRLTFSRCQVAALKAHSGQAC